MMEKGGEGNIKCSHFPPGIQEETMGKMDESRRRGRRRSVTIIIQTNFNIGCTVIC